MYRVLFMLTLFASTACDSPRRGHTIRVAACVEGRIAPCACPGGGVGMQVCQSNNEFGACDCPEIEDAGFDGDGGEDEDASLRKDAGFDDAGFFDDDGGFNPEDGGFNPEDGGFNPGDTGARDVGFDAGDTGFDTGPRDVGFDAGDAGRDAGFPDTSFPDGGFFPDPDGGLPFPDGGLGSLCGLLPELGFPCTADIDCNTIIPFGLLICQGFVCVESCLCDNGPVCVSPQTCDPLGGRCF